MAGTRMRLAVVHHMTSCSIAIALAFGLGHCVPSERVAIPEAPASPPTSQSHDEFQTPPIPTMVVSDDYPDADRAQADLASKADAIAADEILADAASPLVDHVTRLKYYRTQGGGSCALPGIRGVDVVAAPRAIYDRMTMCGACLAVQGPSGNVVVQVADLCDGCPRDVLDLSAKAYPKVAATSRETPTGTWKLIACPVPGDIKIRFKEGASRFWTAFQLRNHRYPILAVAWRRDGPWIVAERCVYNHFFVRMGVGVGRFSLRMTSVLGQQLDVDIPAWRAGEVIDAKVQFDPR